MSNSWTWIIQISYIWECRQLWQQAAPSSLIRQLRAQASKKVPQRSLVEILIPNKSVELSAGIIIPNRAGMGWKSFHQQLLPHLLPSDASAPRFLASCSSTPTPTLPWDVRLPGLPSPFRSPSCAYIEILKGSVSSHGIGASKVRQWEAISPREV